MDLIEEIQAFAAKIPERKKQVATEEATKTALILPFIQIMGYNVFDPNEVVPEYIADVAEKKEEKVDYAILKGGVPILIFECKAVNVDLNKDKKDQLSAYFPFTPAPVAILTNGITYQFFTDLEEANILDKKPFLEINLEDIKEPAIQKLKKFTKSGFNPSDITDFAADLMYTNEIKQILNKSLLDPSKDVVHFYAGQVYTKKLTQQALEKFTPITKNAFNQFVDDIINKRLEIAKKSDEQLKKDKDTEIEEEETGTSGGEVIRPGGIVTTTDETDAFNIIRAIVSEIVDPSRIFIKDAKAYCPIFFDDNNKKPVVRLYFTQNKKSIGIFDKDTGEMKKEEIKSLIDLFKYRDNFKDIVKKYLG